MITERTQRLRQASAKAAEALLEIAALTAAEIDLDDDSNSALESLMAWADAHESWLVDTARHDDASLRWEREGK